MPQRYPVSLKSETDSTFTLEGWAVVYGGEDLTGDYFDATSDLWLKTLGSEKPLLYDHGFNKGLGDMVLGKAVLEPRDEGVWFEAEVSKAAKYAEQVRALVAAGIIGASSGAVSHLVKSVPQEDGRNLLAVWPIAELSLTPTPAEPRTVGVDELKALIAQAPGTRVPLKAMSFEDVRDEICELLNPSSAMPMAMPADDCYRYVVATYPDYVIVEQCGGEDEGYWRIPYTVAADGTVTLGEAVQVEQTYTPVAKSANTPSVTVTRSEFEAAEPTAHEDAAMSDEQIKALEGEVAAIKSGQDSLNEKLEALLKHMQDEPAVKNAGYFTQDGGTADKGIKSFGDFLLAIRRNDVKRLQGVYGSVKDLAEGAGTTGGYLVPTEHRTDLLRVAIETSPILGLVRTIPVMADAGTWPALDQYTAPTAGAGNTAFAGGIVATNTAEAAALTETQATFKEIQWRVNKVGGYTEVSNELIADSAEAIEALLRGLFAIAVAARRERNILRGSGVGEPLGIVNAPALVSVTPGTNSTFSYTDALTMASRFKGVSGNVRWIMHQSVLPDFGGSSWVQGNNIIRIEDAFPYGKPILSEHMQQADYDDVILADLGAYLLFERQALSIAYSEHAAFTTDKGTWRFTERLDGQPWQKAAITLADPEGSYTVSPFVLHHDA